MSDELKPIDPNHDLVPTLRMMGGLLFDQAADEIDKWRNAYRASVKRPADELWVIGMGCVQKHKIISTPIIINGQLHVYTDTGEGAEIATLRTQLAAMTAERDELQTSMDELRKACAEVIGADPQTWPDHGNAPLAIAASLGLRSIELDRATAERDNWKETSVTIAGELADTKDERDAAMAKVVVLRDALVESVDQMIGDAMSIEWECGDCRMLEKMEADHDLSPAIYLARNALEATK